MRKRLVGLVVAALSVLAVSPALAHVTVNPSSAEKGSFSKLTFRVPNESDTASTVSIEVNFPTDAPLAFVSVKPVPGWTAKVERAKLAVPVTAFGEEITEAVSKITWSGGKIGPGEFQEFDVSAGPLPEKASSLIFKALQTYDDGEIARWIDETPASGEEPEHPAPVLTLTAAASEESDKAEDDDGGAGMATGLSAVALVVALGAGALALSARRGNTEA